MTPDLPKPLRQLIAESIDSVDTLEILLLLERTPQTFWTAMALESHLGIPAGCAESRLTALAEKRLAVRGESGAYCYQCPEESRRSEIRNLAAAWRDRRAAVVNAIRGENAGHTRDVTDDLRPRGD